MAFVNISRLLAKQCAQIHACRNVTALNSRFEKFRIINLVRNVNNEWDNSKLRMMSGTTVDHDPVQCWKCGTIVDQHRIIFCKSCHTVQKPQEGVDYFEIFGQEKAFDLDPKQLTNRYRLLQMQLHPDRFSNHTKEEKEVSAEYSSLVNRAYKTLLSPLDRALYLLELHEHPLVENEVNIGIDFLTEIMEINEELAELDTAEELEKFNQQNQERLADLIRKASEAFKSKDWVTARNLIGRLKYYANIQEKIKEVEREWGIIKS